MAQTKTTSSSKPSSKSPTSPFPFLQLSLSLYLLIAFIILIITMIHQASSSQTAQPTPTPQTPPPTLLPSSPSIPINHSLIQPPSLTSLSAIVFDVSSSTILFQKNINQPLLPASTTKIMTALVALDTYPLDQVITITEEERTIGHTMKLTRGERLTVEDLLYGTLVASGNDAALALALSYPHDGYLGFIDAMNQKAHTLHLTNTQFKNVSGVESPGHVSTAKNLALLTQYALSHPVFSHIVSTPSITLNSLDNHYTHHLVSTNELLGSLTGVNGVKTGWTENAGECLITSTTRDNHQIITVVLASKDRFQESSQLIEWTFANHRWLIPEEITLTLSSLPTTSLLL